MSGKTADEESLLKIVDTIAKYENLVNTKVNFKSLSCTGDGYMSIINFVDLIGHKNNKEAVLNLCIKTASKDKNARDNLDMRQGFLTEQHIYIYVLPEFLKLQRTFGIEKPFFSTPICYGTSMDELEEFLVLENLKPKDYFMWNRKIQMSKEYLEVVFKTIAKFHGASFALKAKNPKRFDELTGPIKTCLITKFIVNGADIYNKMIRRAAVHFRSKKEDDIALYLDGFLKTVTEELLGFFTDKNEYSVICHGDFWCNNLLLKNKENDQSFLPEDTCFLDWQCAVLGNPVIDLSYFFWTCSKPELYKDSSYFLDVYYSSLREYLEVFNMNIEDHYPKSELLQSWTRGAKYGMVMSFFIFKAMLVDGSETPDITDKKNAEENTIEEFYKEFSKSPEYMERSENLIKFLYKNKYLTD